MGWLARIAGPRVLLGVAAAAAVAIATLLWLYVSSAEDAATARQQNSQLRQSLSDQRQAVQRLQAEKQNLEQALQTARQATRKAREQADSARSRIDELEESDENVRQWSRRSVPDAVGNELRRYARSGNRDGSGEDSAAE